MYGQVRRNLHPHFQIPTNTPKTGNDTLQLETVHTYAITFFFIEKRGKGISYQMNDTYYTWYGVYLVILQFSHCAIISKD